MLYARESYLNRLRSFKDKDVIKVLTGIRRSGKSTLLSMFGDEIRASAGASAVISVNLEDAAYADVRTWERLYDVIARKVKRGRRTYVFIDEVQQVERFEKAVDALFLNKNLDLYITGSNARLLSGELATLLSGRSVEIRVYPYSFAEYAAANGAGPSPMKCYGDYVRFGGFPYVGAFGGDEDAVATYLEGLYSTIVLKDVVARRKVQSPDRLARIVRYLFDNIGNLTSIKKIADALSATGAKETHPTVENYVEGLKDAYIVHQAARYDLKGRQILKSGCKYYACDMGLRRLVLGGAVRDYGRILENIVYLELLRRCGGAHNVHVGIADDCEVDFVATVSGGVTYVQVAASVRDDATRARELRPFERLKDAYPRLLVTLDEDPVIDHHGVRQVNVTDFLTSDNRGGIW